MHVDVNCMKQKRTTSATERCIFEASLWNLLMIGVIHFGTRAEALHDWKRSRHSVTLEVLDLVMDGHAPPSFAVEHCIQKKGSRPTYWKHMKRGRGPRSATVLLCVRCVGQTMRVYNSYLVVYVSFCDDLKDSSMVVYG